MRLVRSRRLFVLSAVLVLVFVAQGLSVPARARPHAAAQRLQWTSLAVEPLATTDSRVPCFGDGTSGNRVQVIYARPNDVADTFATIVAQLRTLAANVNREISAGAGETKGQRQIRFVTKKCRIDVVNHALSLNSAGSSYEAVRDELFADGFDRVDRIYLVYLDVPSSTFGACGRTGGLGSPPGPGPGGEKYAIVANSCWSDVDDHELLHALGAVGTFTGGNPPHSDGDGHCWDEYDGMCVTGQTRSYFCPYWHWDLPDCRHDDYFHTNPGKLNYLYDHWNSADSPFLGSPPPVNDTFDRATPLMPGVIWGSLAKAHAEPGEPATSGQVPAHSIWYRLDATAGNKLLIDTTGSSADTVVGVYTGNAPNALTLVKQNDNAHKGVTSSHLAVSPTQATTYYIRVDGHAGSIGSVRLNVGYGDQVPTFTSVSPMSGPPGTTVTITGENLFSVDSQGFWIWVNGSFPNNLDVTQTGLTFDIPFGAHTGPITFVGAQGVVLTDRNFRVT